MNSVSGKNLNLVEVENEDEDCCIIDVKSIKMQ